VERLEVVRPRLEDVYLDMIGHEVAASATSEAVA
jgi:hypothetical protein